MDTLKAVAEAIKEKQNFILISHVVPDGDAVGSVLALGLGLKNKGCSVQLLNNDGVPEMYSFMAGSEFIETEFTNNSGNLILLDCSNIERIGGLKEAISEGSQVINIDHHTSNTEFGDLNYIDINASATGEIIYDLLKELDIYIDSDIATCLYTAIVTDTGSFQYENTTNKTHLIASDLILCGADISLVRRYLWESVPLKSITLLSETLSTLKLDDTGQIAWMSLPYEVFKEFSENDGYAEGFVNYPKSIKGVEIGIFLKEFEPQKIKVGMRSKSNEIDVNKLAQVFGGGGHKRAAGCIFEGTIEKAEELIIKEASKLLC